MFFPTFLQKAWRHPLRRELLLWCWPALAVGVVLRVVLALQMPYAFYHVDSPDYLCTADVLLHEHQWEIHAKKTFLVPVLFTVPMLLRVTALIAIPLFQNLLGCGLILITGALCRLWFVRWKLFIIPLTLLVAVNPFLLWYERTLMAEATFVFCTAALALAGTLYARRPTGRRFSLLLLALFLEAGARPEGKLLFGFGLFLLVLVHWGRWRLLWPRLGMMLALAVGCQFITRTSQAGLLLYTSVARLTPDELRCAPGFEAYIAPVRDELRQKWAEHPSFPRVRERRRVAEAVKLYLAQSSSSHGRRMKRSVEDLCLKLAAETCRRNLGQLPLLCYHKFRSTATESPADVLSPAVVYKRQILAYGAQTSGEEAEEVENGSGTLPRTLRLSKRLTGRELHSPEEVRAFVQEKFRPVPWFDRWSAAWLSTVNALRFPDRVLKDFGGGFQVFYYGVPFYFLLGGVGVVVIMFRRGVLQPFHVAWGLALLAFFFTIILTANTKPRFRFVFEPFWFLYAGLLLDCVLLLFSTPAAQSRPVPVQEPALTGAAAS